MSGISGAAVVTMGTIALPRMLERGYDKRLAVGAINCGGGWGILIPPSILMVLYALLTEVSVGRLFASGIGPGILLFVLVSIYIAVRAWLQPSLAPALPIEERGDWAVKLKSLKAVFLPLFIVFLVLGAIFGGFATPTEAAALGVFGALVASAVHRKLSMEVLTDAAMQTLAANRADHVDPVRSACFSTAYTTLGRERIDEPHDVADSRRSVGRARIHAVRAAAARHGARPGRDHADHAAGLPAGGAAYTAGIRSGSA